MNIKKYVPLGLATMLIFGSVVMATSANGLTGNFFKGDRGQRAAVVTAIENSDYDAWVKAVSVNGQLPDFLNVITKDNFAQFVQMHQLLKDGKKDEAKAIADTLGLKFMGIGKGPGPIVNAAADAAIQSGDYDAWVKAVSVNDQMPELLKAVTKDNFAKFSEAMKLEKQGMDLIKQSRDILDSIGVNPPGPGFKKGEGHGRGRGERFESEDNTQTESESK